jgi:hypothetical protein
MRSSPRAQASEIHSKPTTAATTACKPNAHGSTAPKASTAIISQPQRTKINTWLDLLGLSSKTVAPIQSESFYSVECLVILFT